MAETEVAGQHRATYATDKRDGGYLVRITGPRAADFAGMEVPVETKDGQKHTEKLLLRKWFGADKDPVTKKETGQQAALYTFQSRPRETPKPPVF